ncbi:MAG: secretin N-terminal domain-containing protein [Candidatus Omnitrophota bacterium]
MSKKKLFYNCPMSHKFIRIAIVFILISIISFIKYAFAYLETKILLLDTKNRLVAIDKGSLEGLQEKTLFFGYIGNKLIGEFIIFKTSPHVSICEIKNLEEGISLKINDKVTFISAEEKEKLDKEKLSTISPAEDQERIAKEVAEEEAKKRELEEFLLRERAKGIAEAVKSEKELQKMKEKAEAIVKEVIEEKKKAKRIISFDFRDVDIKNIIKSIAREAEINIVIPPDFPSLPITISLKDVDMESALDTILGMVDYAFLKEGNLYKIVKKEVAEKKTISRTFKPVYIQVEKLKSLIDDSGLLSSEGKIVIDSRSNRMVVIDTSANLDKIEELVKQVDVKPRQVNIEAKILDVSLTDTETLGIEWTWVKPRGGATTDDTLQSGFTVDSTGSGKGFFKYGTLDAAEIAVVLEALMKRENANILSKPTITTLNNEEAKINVTSKIPYQTGTTTTETTGGVTTTTISWEEKEVGVTLSVTPYICETGDIIMKIEPTASLLQGYTSEDPETRYPLIMTRSATTQVMVKDGETLVIGGLITQELRDTKTGVPILGDIPILGLPFQKRSKELKNTELIIFITPHIVPSE